MFAALYKFTVFPDKKEQFINAWRGLTELIYEFEGSLGSRLHRTEKPNVFVAYATWPNELIWKKSGEKLPDTASKFRNEMRASCANIETIHKLEMVSNYLQLQPYSK